jgi:FAD/FMN-containing dehydrogenase
MNWLLMSCIVIGTALASTNNDQREYDQALNNINSYLELNELTLRGCPGTKLVISCGNSICEPYKSESIDNCPADCKTNVSVRSYNNIVLCDGYTQTQVPQNVEEVADIVKMASYQGKTVRAIGASHSATEIMCAQGVVVPMSKLKSVIGISKVNNELVVEAESGITVYDLSEWLHTKGYALAGLPHMGFRDVTIGGSIATGSHGSTTKHTGVISNIVKAIEFIDGEGSTHYLERHSSDKDTFKALSASLGMLGIMTKIKLKIQKQFNLAVNVTYHHDSEIMQAQGLISSVKDCDYGQLNWFPGIGKFMKTCGIKTTKASFKDANNVLLNPKIPNFIVKPFKKILQYGACNNTIMCMTQRVRWWQFKLQPPLVITNIRGKVKNKHFVIGPSHRMVSSHLTSNQTGFFQMDWEIAVPASKAQGALAAIKSHVQKNQTCLPLVGVFVRFAPSSDQSLLAHTHSDGKNWINGEPAVFFEMPVYIPVGFTKERYAEYESQFVEFTKMLITKFSGRPHWGKNKQWALKLAIESGAYKDSLSRFKDVMNKFDPKGTFSSKFSRKLGL